MILNGNFLCLSCPSATFAHQHGGFVPRDRLPAKGLFATNLSKLKFGIKDQSMAASGSLNTHKRKIRKLKLYMKSAKQVIAQLLFCLVYLHKLRTDRGNCGSEMFCTM